MARRGQGRRGPRGAAWTAVVVAVGLALPTAAGAQATGATPPPATVESTAGDAPPIDDAAPPADDAATPPAGDAAADAAAELDAAAGDAAAGDAAAGDPAATDPTATDPATGAPATTDPATGAPVTGDPAQPTTDDPAATAGPVVVDEPDDSLPAWVWVAVGLGIVLAAAVAGALVLASGRFERLAPVGHALGEAGWRLSNRWSEFVDWLRFGSGR